MKNRCRPSPISLDARQALLEILLSQGKYERVLREAERLPGEGPAAFAGHYLKGQALFGLGNFPAALAELLAASQIVNSDANLLNLIGRSFLKIGDSGAGGPGLHRLAGLEQGPARDPRSCSRQRRCRAGEKQEIDRAAFRVRKRLKASMASYSAMPRAS